MSPLSELPRPEAYRKSIPVVKKYSKMFKVRPEVTQNYDRPSWMAHGRFDINLSELPRPEDYRESLIMVCHMQRFTSRCPFRTIIYGSYRPPSDAAAAK
jgi:hypothetical protein